MNDTLHSTLPVRLPKRKCMFSIRLTEAEQVEIETLAIRLRMPSSFMARHFIMEAVAHHSIKVNEEAAVEAK